MTKGAGRFCRIGTLAFTALAGCAILGGCASLGGELDLTVEEAGVVVPSDWAFSEAAAVPVDLSEYWTALGDPLLDDFVRQAIVENRDIALGIARLDQARAGLRLARAGYLPNVSGRAGVSRDVGDGDLRMVRGEQVVKPGWADRFHDAMKKKKAADRK